MYLLLTFICHFDNITYFPIAMYDFVADTRMYNGTFVYFGTINYKIKIDDFGELIIYIKNKRFRKTDNINKKYTFARLL